ncbi:MAG: zinc ribbon domain-containing protein [Spirochaetaceae bacterium]|nr:zinc ribbon domain-containing protein [Spirochaetaceae bacterium]
MAFCSKCGKPLKDGANFCSGCGAPVSNMTPEDVQSVPHEADTSEVRKQVFVGSIRKCPNCGQQITSDTAKCPSCGFIIEKKNVSGALDLFVKKLTSISDDNEKREFIETYAIPNNKEDIRDLLNYAASQRDKDYEYYQDKVFWVDAWNNKCKHILNQAFDTFGADSEFAVYLKEYQEGVVKSAEENEALKRRLFSIKASENRKEAFVKFLKGFFILVVILAVIGGAAFGIRSCSIKVAENRKIKEEQAQQQAVIQAEQDRINAEKEAQRQKLIAGCVVPKENVNFGGMLAKLISVASDATIKTENISKRREINNWNFLGDWCLDTTVSVDITALENISDYLDEEVKKCLPDEKKKYQFFLKNEDVSCSYHSPTETGKAYHTFDNINSLVGFLSGMKKGQTQKLMLKLTLICDSEEDCEQKAISLHNSQFFDFNISGISYGSPGTIMVTKATIY